MLAACAVLNLVICIVLNLLEVQYNAKFRGDTELENACSLCCVESCRLCCVESCGLLCIDAFPKKLESRTFWNEEV